MSNQPVVPAANTQSLDDILNQLEKTTGISSAPTTTPPQPISSSLPTESAPATSPVTHAPVEVPAPVIETVPPVEPAPVATLAENPVTPTTPTPEVSEPAPMVVEEPTLDTAKAVEPTPAPLPMPEPAADSVPTDPVPPKSSPVNKVALGILGILMLAGVAGIGVYASRMQQSTLSNAYATPSPVITTQAAATPVAATPLMLSSPNPVVSLGTISGKVCTDIFKKAGALNLYNLGTKTLYTKDISNNETTYQVKVAPGQYLVLFATTQQEVLGATSSTHDLKHVSLPAGGTVTNIDICDKDYKTESTFTETYQTANAY